MLNQFKSNEKFTLFLSSRSPFARRIRLTLHRLRLPTSERDLGNVFEPQPELAKLNPLGMIPTLVTPENEVYSDSNNILEYLHEITGSVWPQNKQLRLQMRQTAVWCTGVMQSAILHFQETKMHAQPDPKWINEHVESIKDTLRTLSSLNEELWFQDGKLTQPAWDLAVAIEYLSLRLPEIDWQTYSSFTKLLALARANEHFVETSPNL
jgi:glutathione S-transferase